VYKLWIVSSESFPKKLKYTLGGKIDDLFLECLDLLFTASFQPKDRKLIYLDKVSVRFDLLKFLLRIAWEIDALEQKKYVHISELLVEIGRMIGGWMNKIKKETQPPPKRG
jgi:hypothetical protein